MKKIRRIAIAAFAAAACLTLAGCGAQESAESVESAQESAESVESAQESVQPSPSDQVKDTIEVTEYFPGWESLVDELNMKKTGEAWQFGGENSYEADGFCMEWLDDACSMKDTEQNGITVNGISVGDDKSEAEKLLLDSGWKNAYGGDTSNSFLIEKESGSFLITIDWDDDGAVSEWYICNWPQL